MVFQIRAHRFDLLINNLRQRIPNELDVQLVSELKGGKKFGSVGCLSQIVPRDGNNSFLRVVASQNFIPDHKPNSAATTRPLGRRQR